MKSPKIFFSDQDHADEADNEVVGEANQPGGDEVVDRAPPTAAQPSHVTRLRDHWKKRKTINIHTGISR